MESLKGPHYLLNARHLRTCFYLPIFQVHDVSSCVDDRHCFLQVGGAVCLCLFDDRVWKEGEEEKDRRN